MPERENGGARVRRVGGDRAPAVRALDAARGGPPDWARVDESDDGEDDSDDGDSSIDAILAEAVQRLRS